MSLLGIDVGTTGCKAASYSLEGRLLADAYEEYDVRRAQPGWAELDTTQVWEKIQRTIRKVATETGEPITALAVSSLGEAVTPVDGERRILGPSILNFDGRGGEYLGALAGGVQAEDLYQINGNTPGNHYTLTKLMWLQRNQPELYRRAACFLHWSGLVSYLLGAGPRVDYSLANRTLLFDLDAGGWSPRLLDWAGLDGDKLPPCVPSGQVIGRVSPQAAAGLGLAAGTLIVSGAHDQCANALGCGVIAAGQAVYGMGTYNCIAPVFDRRRPTAVMMAHGLNTEHHAVPGNFVSFIYSMGGAIVKWYRDTFAAFEHRQAQQAGEDVYTALFAEIDPAAPSPVLVLPHWSPDTSPYVRPGASGVVVGLTLETRRADVLKAILEANVFLLKDVVDGLPETGIVIDEFRIGGGGSKSDVGVQLCADILGRPFARPRYREAGTLGAAMLAGIGSGVFSSFEEAVAGMVRLERTFEPDARQHIRYQERHAQYRQLWPLLGDFVQGLAGKA